MFSIHHGRVSNGAGGPKPIRNLNSPQRRIKSKDFHTASQWPQVHRGDAETRRIRGEILRMKERERLSTISTFRSAYPKKQNSPFVENKADHPVTQLHRGDAGREKELELAKYRVSPNRGGF